MIFRDISLKPYNTFGLDYKADLLVSLNSEEDSLSFIKNMGSYSKSILVLGGGSNILFTGDFKGTILIPGIEGIKMKEENGENFIVSAGAGVKWDHFVEWTVNQGFGGLENLSLIPGTVGATPIQNIGAYGAEVKDTIEKVRAISLTDGTIREFNNDECRFDYRDSIFKNELKGRYVITMVFYRLSGSPVLNTRYGSLQKEVEKIGKPSIKTVREAVIRIRKNKLPDPGITGNAGSFFRNPLVNNEKVAKLKIDYPGIPLYEDLSGGIKLASGWLIEQCGWKGKRIGDTGVHEKQALVLVNYGRATGKDIYDLSERIRLSVFEKFGVELEREVEVI
jgi:UDP-N-acetylmuramate dehydrogenase